MHLDGETRPVTVADHAAVTAAIGAGLDVCILVNNAGMAGPVHLGRRTGAPGHPQLSVSPEMSVTATR